LRHTAPPNTSLRIGGGKAASTKGQAMQQLKPLLGGPGSWREANADVFPSDDSCRWFLRRHGREAIEFGALMMLRNRWIIRDEARWSEFIVKIGCEQALRLC
jgi:hypothetical protein